QCKGDSKRDVENCEVIKELFGNPEGIGGISITDAKILAFPVRTLRGVFGWIMSPLILERYKRDLFLLGRSIDWSIPKLASNEEARVGKGSNLIVEEDGEKCIYIEDLQLKCIEDEYVEKIARDVAGALPKNDVYKELKERFEKDLIIVSDDVFKDLVYLTTEIVTRIKIDPE
ncbi:MAG: RAMP superfamily CRISPR-associated protein, partial [Candidatus Micrarchaeia archaeon]